MFNYYEEVLAQLSQAGTKVSPVRTTHPRKKRVKCRIRSLKLSERLKTLPLYDMFKTEKVTAFLESIAQMKKKNDITTADILAGFVLPYRNIVVKSVGNMMLIDKFVCNTNGIVSLTNITFIIRHPDSRKLSIIYEAVGVVHNSTINFSILTRSLVHPNVPLTRDKVADKEQQPVAALIKDLFMSFINISVFSKFDGIYTDTVVQKQNTGTKPKQTKRKLFRPINTKLTHKRTIILNGKEVATKTGKTWTLKHKVEMPKSKRYLRHKIYSKNGTLPIKYDLENKPYYQHVPVKNHVRGEHLPTKEERIKYQA